MQTLAPVDISVVIPVYRSEKTLETLRARVGAVLDSTGLNYEFVFVDDDSPDRSWQVLTSLQAADPRRVAAVQLMRNAGQHNALMCGFRHARGDFIVTMDDDLQHPPEEISRLMREIQATGDDLVYGVPAQKRHHLWRNAGSALATTVYRLVFRTRVRPTAFRVMRRQLVEAILCYSLNYTYVDGLLAWNTRRIGQVSVEHHPRSVGRSGYSVSKLVQLAFNLITNFSLIPLKVVSLVGFLTALAGFATALYYLIQFLLQNIVVPGYASTIVASLVLGGIQLLALGVMGEYLGRLHLNVNRKPQYTERHVLAGETVAEQQRVAAAAGALKTPPTSHPGKSALQRHEQGNATDGSDSHRRAA